MIGKILKSRIFAFILGAIVFGSIGVYATATIVDNSKDISFNNTGTSLQSTNVELFNSSVYEPGAQRCNTANIEIAGDIHELTGEYYIVMQLQGQSVSGLQINDIWYD